MSAKPATSFPSLKGDPGSLPDALRPCIPGSAPSALGKLSGGIDEGLGFIGFVAGRGGSLNHTPNTYCCE